MGRLTGTPAPGMLDRTTGSGYRPQVRASTESSNRNDSLPRSPTGSSNRATPHHHAAGRTADLATGQSRPGARQEGTSSSCSRERSIPRPSVGLPPCADFAAGRLPPRPASTAPRTAAPRSSRSTPTAGRPSAPSAGTAAGSTDRPRRPASDPDGETARHPGLRTPMIGATNLVTPVNAS